jgi:elongation factor Ts
MSIDPKIVMKLREETGAGVLESRKTLEEANGDYDKAKLLLRQKGIDKAIKKQSRITGVGRVGCYIHGNQKVGAMVELCCETDFVAKNDEFLDLLRDLCLQVTGANPQYIGREQIPAGEIEIEKKKFEKDLVGKPPEIAAKILEGKLGKAFFAQKCLLDQPFLNPAKFDGPVGDMIKAKITKFGENITVRRFVRYEAGQ